MALELTIGNIDAGYGAVRALHGVSMRVGNGETAALLGTNGNGKSTLMKCVMGMVRPTRGTLTLTIDGVHYDLTKLSTEEIVNIGVAMVPEGRRLFPRLTVEENLLLGAFRPQARADIPNNIRFCYEAFPLLNERRRQLAGSMSGGQQQMLAIARALMSSPKLLLVDEPSVGLAPILVSQTITTIKELKERYGLTVLMAEQNFHQAIRIADRGYIIVHGEIVFEGTVAELEKNDLVKITTWDGIVPAAEALAKHNKLDAIMVLGTSLTFYRGFEAHEKLLQRLRQIGLPVATMSSAVVDGLRALGAKKIGVSTAYADEVNKRLRNFLTDSGFEVQALEGFGIERFGGAAEKTGDDIIALAGRVSANARDAQGMLISCGGLKTLQVGKTIEDKYGLPVVSSTPAAFWAAMRLVGESGKLPGYGRLFETVH